MALLPHSVLMCHVRSTRDVVPEHSRACGRVEGEAGFRQPQFNCVILRVSSMMVSLKHTIEKGIVENQLDQNTKWISKGGDNKSSSRRHRSASPGSGTSIGLHTGARDASEQGPFHGAFWGSHPGGSESSQTGHDNTIHPMYFVPVTWCCEVCSH